jgi:RHS repeat-associated protein
MSTAPFDLRRVVHHDSRSLWKEMRMANGHENGSQENGAPASPDKFFVHAPSLSLPKGGGAIRGIGEKFTANPVTGTGALTVPIATSPGRSGFGPQLSLSYDSGSGNGPFGLGWSLSLPSITRKTDKGLPRYQDAYESDVFILSGAEDLVPVLVQDGQGKWVREDVPSRDGCAIMRYRPRIEGLFSRIERWTRQSDGDTHWRSISKDNITTFYGLTSESRIVDPADASRVFSWLICQSQDDKGNAIVYSYAAEDPSNIDLTQANERNRTAASRSANRYPTRVKYGNQQSLLIQPDVTKLAWLFEVVFDYGEGYFQAAAPDAEGRVFASATLAPAGTWPARQDPFSRHRSCFEVRTYRLCQRVLMFHHFAVELGVPDCLVRSTEFSYQQNAIATVMTGVTQSGYVLEPRGYLQASLPPLEFEYSQLQLENAVREVDAKSLANLPANIDGSHYRWLDLDGEGIQGILAEQGDAWFYKRNLTPLSLANDSTEPEPTARFEPLTEVSQLPGSSRAQTPSHQFMNLSGDGHLDCAVLDRPGAGFYARTEEESWEPFTPLESAPNVDWNDPNLRLIDLDGDGFSDILITAQDAVTYYPSLGHFGFDAPIQLPKATDEEAGPAVIFADSSKAIFLSDMSGDGLSDIVRIRNGEVCYWPNLGYGRFGSKVTMDQAPWFDSPDRFEPARIRLGDVDGSGVTDIIYVGADGVTLYFNQSGNSWSEPVPLMQFPAVSDLAEIEAQDLMGNGTICLVWTSSSPGDVGRSLRYVNLMGGDKPYLLVRSWNNLGAETRVVYTPSTAFYLADRAAGTPWATRLPIPVHVVERVETYDWISRNRFVTRYTYHHGYYDGTEREFRGFGMVEQCDTEELGVLTQTGAFPDATNIDRASYVPPILTKTWFHTGAYPMGGYVTRIYDEEYWSEPGLTPDQATAMLLPDSPLEADLTGDEIREALRSLKGVMLRQEVYALDGTVAAALPYSVSERNYTLNRLQPFGGNRHAVFLTHARESLDLHYERKVYMIAGTQRADPRVTHAFVLEVDDFGNEKKSVAIGYGRRYQDPDPLLIAADHAAQSATLITYTESDYTNPILTDDAYRTPLPADVRTYELTGYTPSGTGARFESLDFVKAAATGFELVFDTEVPYQGAATGGRQRRLIKQTRTLYRSDDLESALPLATLQPLALPFASYRLSLTPELIATIYQRPHAGAPTENLVPDLNLLTEKGGYVLTGDQQAIGLFPASDPSGEWWIPSGRIFYSPGPNDTPAVELSTAQAHFFVGRRYQDVFGNNTTVAYDPYDLLPAEIVDPVQNVVSSTSDYRVLQPIVLTDPNGNHSAVAFDALGQVAGTAVMDKLVTAQQDSLAAFIADLTQAQIDGFFASPRGPQAAVLLGNATSRIVYDLGRFARLPSTPQTPAPAYAATIARETHVQNLAAGQASRLQVSVSYSDGFGREIQRKLQADPGSLIDNGPTVPMRWMGSGWTIWNNKGRPVRKYEPFFTDSSDFSFGTMVGVSSTLFYDPAGRVVATLHPDHSWEKVVFDPWRQDSWDANDTVLIPDPSADADAGSFFQRLPQADYLPTWYAQRSATGLGAAAQDAAQKTAVHANTPSTVHFDTLGRAFLTFAFNRTQQNGSPPVEGHYRTFVTFDIEGNQRQITDALDRVIMTYDYDMQKARLRQNSADAGVRWILSNAAGKPYLGWDSRDHRLEHDYDAARRPVGLWVQTWVSKAGQNPVLAERTIYGEGQPNDQALNLRGKPFQRYDAAGVATNTAFDFTGNLLSSSRQLLVDYANPVDWSLSPAPQLTGEIFTASSTFDALNRPVTLVSPDGSVAIPIYDDAGKLDQVSVNLRGTATATSFVTNIDYNAKGQRTLIEYGNAAETAYSYDPETFRLTELKTTRTSDNAVLQDLTYSYDPVGNITSIADAAQQTIYFSNQVVKPNNDYTYDAVYRLISTAGRELIGQLAQPQVDWDDSPRMNRPLPTDGQAMRDYVENYSYDAMGNFLQIAHQAANGNWTRTYVYDEPNASPTNNRLTSTSVGSLKEPYTSDADGNMTQMPHLREIAWDFKDQLASTQQQVVNNAPGETTCYVYTASGQRMRKVTQSGSGTKIKERIYLGNYEVYREYASDGSTVTLERQTLHVMDEKRRVAMAETNTTSGARTILRYQFDNHLGSASLELDANAAIISYEEYYPYGSTSYQAAPGAVQVSLKRYRYTGRERDDETGFYYHQARYYAPWLGRWTSCDPKGTVEGTNLYGYVSQNPIRWLDPTGYQGLEPVTIEPNPMHAAGADPAPQSNPDAPKSFPGDLQQQPLDNQTGEESWHPPMSEPAAAERAPQDDLPEQSLDGRTNEENWHPPMVEVAPSPGPQSNPDAPTSFPGDVEAAGDPDFALRSNTTAPTSFPGDVHDPDLNGCTSMHQENCPPQLCVVVKGGFVFYGRELEIGDVAAVGAFGIGDYNSGSGALGNSYGGGMVEGGVKVPMGYVSIGANVGYEQKVVSTSKDPDKSLDLLESGEPFADVNVSVGKKEGAQVGLGVMASFKDIESLSEGSRGEVSPYVFLSIPTKKESPVSKVYGIGFDLDYYPNGGSLQR